MDLNSILFPVLSLGSLGLLFGLGLGLAGIKFAVKEDPNLPLVRDTLPGANCGGCGFAGCDAFAAAVVSGKAEITGCPVGGRKVAAAIAEVLGIVADEKERHVAFVKCGGSCDKTRSNYEYDGLMDCTAITHLASGGSKSCTYGCLGGGSCYRACNFNAIEMVDGIAKIKNENCTACGKCINACPKNLIELLPDKNLVKVNCNSRDNGKMTKTNCDVGCIGCKICEKACNFDAVHIENNLARVDYTKCTMCNECTKKCPTKAICSLVKE